MLFRSVCILLFTASITGTSYSRNDSIYTSKWNQVIPSENLPKEIKTGRSNNNIDAAFWNGRYVVAFRTAPTHFASKDTRLYVISTLDFQNWQYEREIALGSDIREPRLVNFKDTLRLYFFQGGTIPTKFEPRHIFTTTGGGELYDIRLDGYVPWRLRVRDSMLYLSAYYGKDLYNEGHRADLRLFQSINGYDFYPVSEAPQDTTLGAEEGEFLFDRNGNLWANIRLEGSGSLLCYAHKDSIDRWHKKFSRFKYDSALMFEQGDDIFMIARRHWKGAATKTMIPKPFRRKLNLLKYSLSKKSTCLYRLDKHNLEWIPLLDFPSTGDTAFPAIVPASSNSYHVLNYSSDIRKRDKIWLLGQLRPTFIYHALLHFE